jgi:D-tyrosyl-tRNA(Tyr) deacylase
MRAVVQLVSEASVRVGETTTGGISRGLVVFLGVHAEDSVKDATYLAEKIANLRIFPDSNRLMNRSVLDVGGEALVVSQFTLFGDCRKGRRPSYNSAAPPDKARELYFSFITALKNCGVGVATGEFKAMMEVSLVNSGPVTLLVDSAKLF